MTSENVRRTERIKDYNNNVLVESDSKLFCKFYYRIRCANYNFYRYKILVLFGFRFQYWVMIELSFFSITNIGKSNWVHYYVRVLLIEIGSINDIWLHSIHLEKCDGFSFIILFAWNPFKYIITIKYVFFFCLF